MPKKNKLIVLFFSLSLVIISCHSIYPLGQERGYQIASTEQKLLPFKVPKTESLPSLEPDPLLNPEEFILKYRKIAEVSEPISEGKASWYGPNFHGRLTANGERFDMQKLTAAHPSLPFGTLVWVENTQNGQGVLVRINDRGPYAGDRVIDLSRRAAQELEMIGHGVTNVQLFIVKKGAQSQDPELDNTKLYTIQLGIFKKGKRAFKYAKKIKDSRVEIFDEHNQKYYGVFYGRYPDREAALSKKEEFTRQEIVGHVKQIEIK